jgi:NADH-quinone oxidoreductase subunit J
MGHLSMEALTTFGVTSAIMMLFTPKAAASVCFLLAVFFTSALMILSFDLEFLAYALITVYVGAVAILLLFVAKVLYSSDDAPGLSLCSSSRQTLVALIFICAFFLTVYARYLSLCEGFFLFNLLFNQNGDTFIATFHGDSIALLGTTLYSHYGVILLIAGYVLLLGMFGAIAVTLNVVHYDRVRRLRKTRLKSNRFFSPAPLRGLYRFNSLLTPSA